MNANSSQVPLPPPEARKHSKLGIGSFISAIVALLFMFPWILEYLGVRLFTLDLIFPLLLGGLAALVGTGLGIAAVVQKGTRKTFGILGLVFSSMILLSSCALVGIGIFWLSRPRY
jgi:hypothetical protein